MQSKLDNLVFDADPNDMAKRLIFLASQPRAGSTMLQRILGGHPDIHTTSEPWLMLHPVYALRSTGIQSSYDANLANEAIKSFLQKLPEGDDAYYRAVAKMAGHLYGRSLVESGKKLFLDKTPRYYSILPEIARVFPAAKFIVLLRHPLAILSSICQTWVGDDLPLLSGFRSDLFDAPQLLLQGIGAIGNQQLTVRYENLLESPESQLEQICDFLEIESHPDLVNYGQRDLGRWNFGDQTQVRRHDRPMSEHADHWIDSLSQPQFWRFASDYSAHLGRDTFTALGYDYDETLDLLRDHKPGPVALFRSSSLASIVERPVGHLVQEKKQLRRAA